jgi:hypothetical protein
LLGVNFVPVQINLGVMSMNTRRGPSHFGAGPSCDIPDARLLLLTLWVILIAMLASSLYASVDARGLYADGVSYLVSIYSDEWFELFDTRSTVQILRQSPIVFLSRYTSATLFECGQVFTFVMLTMPTVLCALCWFIAPRNGKVWILFPLAALLTGFAATSMHAIGEAAIATSYYWILLFLLLFRTCSATGQALFFLLCIPAFRLHEGAFPLTAVLLAGVAVQADASRKRLFVGASTLLLAAIFAYQLRWVMYPQFPDDRDGIVRGLTHFEYLYVDGHFNLQLVTAIMALVALSAVFFAYTTQPVAKAVRVARKVAIGWAFFALATMAVAILVEQSFSPYAHLQARYHPVIISAALGAVMILLLRYQLPEQSWMQPATIFILISLCATQTVADIVATNRWNAYVADLRGRLANGHGLIPWETTLHTANERVDVNWRLMKIGWVVPFNCIVYAPNGMVNAIIAPPIGTTFQALDLHRPYQLPKLRGIIYTPYERFLAAHKLVD